MNRQMRAGVKAAATLGGRAATQYILTGWRLRVPEMGTTSDNLARFLGGSPLTVALRLVVLSVVLGLVLSALGFSPLDIVASLRALAGRVYDTGFAAIVWVWRYFLLGAVIVFPLFLVMRLFRLGRRERYEV